MASRGYGNVSLDTRLLFRVDVAVKQGLARSRAGLVHAAVLEYLDKNVQRKVDEVPVHEPDFIAFDRTKEARTS